MLNLNTNIRTKSNNNSYFTIFTNIYILGINGIFNRKIDLDRVLKKVEKLEIRKRTSS